MANQTGILRMQELISEFGLSTIDLYAGHILDAAEQATRRLIDSLPDGEYYFEDSMEDDGQGNGPFFIRVTIRIRRDTAEIDFRKTDPQAPGCINAVLPVTVSCVLYVLSALHPDNIPVCDGCLRPVSILTNKGSLVDAEFPAAVSGGNVETSQRIVDVLLGALAGCLPKSVPAASQGTMNNIAAGGIDPRSGAPFSYYETLAGGCGAGMHHHGASAVHSHMTNTKNTPVEALEYTYPIRVQSYRIRKDSGGKGKKRGGDGIVREFLFLAKTEVTVVSERRRIRPYGLFGGEPGAAGQNIIIRGSHRKLMPAKFMEVLKPGEVLRIETPGGGGYGAA